MRLSGVPGRLALPALALAAIVVLLGATPSTQVFAEPPAGTPAADPEGGSQSLREQLEAAGRGYNDAKARLEVSQAHQIQLTEATHRVEAELVRLDAEVDILSVTAYKTGPMSGVVALLDSGSPQTLYERARALDSRVRSNSRLLRELSQTTQTLAGKQAALDAETTVERDQLAEMDKRRKAAESALAPVGGTSGTGPGGGTANANPAPRAPDGTWPRESCTLPDPTTSGCLTPRTLHALQQARAAGFTHHTSCFTNGSWGEHPQGRACDFAAQANGFGGVATGEDKAYGDRLAAWLIANTDRLGVLYVIWFRQIWMPGTGWRAYTSGNGTPAGDHTNHVHLSVQ